MAKLARTPPTSSGPLNRLGTAVGTIIFGLFGLAFAAAGVSFTVTGFRRDGWGVVAFSAVFVTIGLGLTAAAIASVPMQRRQAERAAAHPDQPWLWAGTWTSTTLVDHAAGRLVWTWLLAVAVNGCALAVVRRQLVRQASDDPPRWFLLILLVVAIALFAYAVNVSLRFVRYGRSVLRLDPFPGQVGGRLAGTVHVGGNLDAAGAIRLRLTCSRVTSNGEDTTRSLLWEDEQEVRAPPWSGAGSAIPVQFRVPADQPPTRPRGQTRDAIEWRLEAAAVAGGPAGYRSRFDVPVFEVADPVTATPVTPASPHGEPASHPGIVLSRLSGGGCAIHFAAGRNVRSALFVTTLAVVFVAGGLYLPLTRAPVWPRLIVWSFAALLIWGAIQSWLASATVVARPSGLSVDRGLPLLRRHREMPAGSVTAVTQAVTGQVGDQAYYNLEVVTVSGRVRLVAWVRDKRVAEWASSELMAALGKARPR